MALSSEEGARRPRAHELPPPERERESTACSRPRVPMRESTTCSCLLVPRHPRCRRRRLSRRAATESPTQQPLLPSTGGSGQESRSSDSFAASDPNFPHTDFFDSNP